MDTALPTDLAQTTALVDEAAEILAATDRQTRAAFHPFVLRMARGEHEHSAELTADWLVTLGRTAEELQQALTRLARLRELASVAAKRAERTKAVPLAVAGLRDAEARVKAAEAEARKADRAVRVARADVSESSIAWGKLRGELPAFDAEASQRIDTATRKLDGARARLSAAREYAVRLAADRERTAARQQRRHYNPSHPIAPEDQAAIDAAQAEFDRVSTEADEQIAQALQAALGTDA